MFQCSQQTANYVGVRCQKSERFGVNASAANHVARDTMLGTRTEQEGGCLKEGQAQLEEGAEGLERYEGQGYSITLLFAIFL